MQVDIQSVADLGLVVRAVRKHGAVRIDDFAANTGVSKTFVSDVERGKSTVQLGLVLQLLAELGIPLTLDIPQAAQAKLDGLRSKGGVRQPKKRQAGKSSKLK